MSASKTVSKTQLVHDWIEEGIFSGRLGPGYRLVIGDIARELDVSVPPVREALRLLEAEELIRFEKYVGARVTQFDRDEYRNALEVVSVVEGSATAMSAPRLSAVELAQARELNRRMESTLTEFDTNLFMRLNFEFHGVLCGRCPNPRMLELLDQGWRRAMMIGSTTFRRVPQRAFDSIGEHDRLLDLIERGAPSIDIELAAREHCTATMTAILERR